jgi:hypothetical protein
MTASLCNTTPPRKPEFHEDYLSPSLAQLAREIGETRAGLSLYAADFTRTFGFANRGQIHGWNRKPGGLPEWTLRTKAERQANGTHRIGPGAAAPRPATTTRAAAQGGPQPKPAQPNGHPAAGRESSFPPAARRSTQQPSKHAVPMEN